MKKRLLAVFFFCLLAFFIFFFYQGYAFTFFVKDHQIIKLVLKKNFFSQTQKELLVEVVNSKESITNGLSLRTDLETADHQKIDGMLFVFPKKEIRQFWMKDMLFDIDICWLDDLNLFACERRASFSSSNQELKIYHSPKISNLVLETKPNKLVDQDIKAKLFFKWW